MRRFRIQDLQHIEHSPTSPASLRAKIAAMVANSTACKARVEAVNSETGEYRLVLQGTLDKEETKFEED